MNSQNKNMKNAKSIKRYWTNYNKNSLDFIKVFVIYNYPFEIPQSNAKLLFRKNKQKYKKIE